MGKWIEFDFCGNNKIATVLEASGPAEICIGQQEGFLGEFLENNKLCFFRAIKSISLNPFFFLYITLIEVKKYYQIFFLKLFEKVNLSVCSHNVFRGAN